MSEWISVDERLPEPMDFRRVAVLRAEYDDDDLRLDIVSANHVTSHRSEYTHWLPLPVLPPAAR